MSGRKEKEKPSVYGITLINNQEVDLKGSTRKLLLEVTRIYWESCDCTRTRWVVGHRQSRGWCYQPTWEGEKCEELVESGMIVSGEFPICNLEFHHPSKKENNGDVAEHIVDFATLRIPGENRSILRSFADSKSSSPRFWRETFHRGVFFSRQDWIESAVDSSHAGFSLLRLNFEF